MDENTTPSETPFDETRGEAAPAAAIVRSAPGTTAPAFDSTPIYRVVEVTRDANGRLRKEGRIWHTDLNRMRKFGRAVASNSASHKVLIADAAGDVMEALQPPAGEERQSRWDSWESIALPPCPPKIKHKPRKTAAAPAPIPTLQNPFAALDVDALRATLTGPGAERAAAEGDSPKADDTDVQVLLP